MLSGNNGYTLFALSINAQWKQALPFKNLKGHVRGHHGEAVWAAARIQQPRQARHCAD